MMVPARLAIALCDSGWYLRDEIVWQKPDAMPASVKDRTSPSHEMIYLLAKSRKYWYDPDAIAEPLAASSVARLSQPGLTDQIGSVRANAGGKTNGNMKAVSKMPQGWANSPDYHEADPRYPIRLPDNFKGSLPGRAGSDGQDRRSDKDRLEATTRNCRSVWTFATGSFSEAHFATFPEELPRRCILAGCPEGGLVLDPFAGSGTTLMVAKKLGRRFVGIELNPEYAAMAERRVLGVTGSLFGGVT